MPITLICPAGHRFDMAAAKFRSDGARCPKCKAVTVRKAKAKPCPAATGCPQVPDCGGCAYEPAAPRAPHPMMAMQGAQTVAEARAALQGRTEGEEQLLDAEESPHVEVVDLASDDCPVDPAELDAEAASGEPEPSLVELFGPLDAELDDPDSPRHQGVFA